MGIFPPLYDDSSLLPIGGFLHNDRIIPISISPPYSDSSLLPIGGFLYSDRIIPISISLLYNDSSLLPYRRIPPLLYNNAEPIIHRYLLLYIVADSCSLIYGFFSLLLPYRDNLRST
jgi:hypothetical protein